MKKKVKVSTEPTEIISKSLVVLKQVGEIKVLEDKINYINTKLNISLSIQDKQKLAGKASSLQELDNYIRVLNVGGSSLMEGVLLGRYDFDN